jgi:hypothetical protein
MSPSGQKLTRLERPLGAKRMLGWESLFRQREILWWSQSAGRLQNVGMTLAQNTKFCDLQAEYEGSIPFTHSKCPVKTYPPNQG